MENKVLGPAVLWGDATVVSALLKERFGVVPDWVFGELDGAAERQLLTWAKRLLTAKDP